MSEFQAGAQGIYQFYSNLYSQGVGIFALSLLLSWCCLAHCFLLPVCTCLKRKNNFNKSRFFKPHESPFPLISAHRGGAKERVENTLSAF